jgi:hypothetical protein
MKYSLLIFLLAFLSFSFYQNEDHQESIHSNAPNNSCLLNSIMTTSFNDSAGIDTTATILSYDKNRRKKRSDNYIGDGGLIIVTYEYDKKGRIKKSTDHYVLKIDAHGLSKGDIANRVQKRFKYKKGAKVPKQVKYLSGAAWKRGIRDDQLDYKGKSSLEYNEKGALIKKITNQSGYPKSTTEYTYDYAKNIVWRTRISHEESGDILENTTEFRYDELIDTEGSTGLGGNINLPNAYDYRFGNNVIYSKMVNGENYKGEKYRGKVVYEYKIEREYNENGYVKRAIKKVIDNIEEKEIGKVYTSTYEYICK